MTGSPSRARRYVLLLVMLCGFAVVLFRLVSLQVLQAAELTAKADRQHQKTVCLLYTSDAADERSSVDLGGRRIIKKKKRPVRLVGAA